MNTKRFVSIAPTVMLPMATLSANTWAAEDVTLDSPVKAGLALLQSFFADGTGQFVVAVFVFLFVIIFLRFLYGPKGKFRDPHWDELNEESRRADSERRRAGLSAQQTSRRKEVLIPLLHAETACFLSYADEFIQADPHHASMLHLKREHTLRVLENARRISEHEADFSLLREVAWQKRSAGSRLCNLFRSDESLRPDRILLLAALYHDLGRFEQLKRYGTFRDADSFNHAAMGAKLLQNNRFMQHETPETKALVRTAVLVHNRPVFPAILSPALHAPVKALMDADKIDILRIFHAELTGKREPDPTIMLGLRENGTCSSSILDAIEAGRCALYADMRTQNDFRMLLGSWFFTLFYPTSRQMIIHEGTLRDIILQLPEDGRTGLIRKRMLALLR